MPACFSIPLNKERLQSVLKGDEGTGKGTLAKAVIHLMGQHGLAISNAKHLVGNFNSHLRDAVFLFADEAFFAGDRQHIGVLKSLITEPYLTIEAKYANAVQSPNFLHVMMASNDEWVVPASLKSRQFLVLDVPNTVLGNRAHFSAIWKQMDDGGYAAMLHDLLAIDLSAFDVRAVPTTDGLHEQRKLSLPVPERWWEDVLHRGYVLKSKHGLESSFGQWMAVVTTELLFTSYSDFAAAARDRHPMSREAFGRFMVRMEGKPARLSNAPVGEHVCDVENAYGGTSRKAQVVKHPRPTAYSLGCLSTPKTFPTERQKTVPAPPTGSPPDGAIFLLEADPERLKNDSVSRFKRLRSAVLRRCFAKASVPQRGCVISAAAILSCLRRHRGARRGLD